jgi:hypothetical protein
MSSEMEVAAIQYLRHLSPDTRTRVTSHFSAEVDEFALLVSKLTETLQRYHAVNPKHDPDNPKEVAFGLMTKSANTLVAGFELVLTGYMWEPPILFRSALEGFAVAWDVVHNAPRFAAWKAGKKFESTLSISSLKKTIEPVGKMYGFLSNMHVHTAPLNSSPPMFMNGDDRKFQFFGLLPRGKEHLRKGEVCFALLTAHLCLQLAELVFHKYSSGLETIEYIPDTDLVRTTVSPRHRRFVEASIEHFRLMSQDPDACLQ